MSYYLINAISKTVKDVEKNFNDAFNQWKEYKKNAYDNLSQSLNQFFKKYVNMPVQNKKGFIDTLNAYKSKMFGDIFMHQDAIKRIDKDETNIVIDYIEKINTVIKEIKIAENHTYIPKETIEDEVLSDEVCIDNKTSFDDENLVKF